MNRPGMSPGLRLSLARRHRSGVDYRIRSPGDPSGHGSRRARRSQSIKGLFYILLTASLLYLLRAAVQAQRGGEPGHWLSRRRNGARWWKTRPISSCDDRPGREHPLHQSHFRRSAPHQRGPQTGLPVHRARLSTRSGRRLSAYSRPDSHCPGVGRAGTRGSRTWYSCMLGPIKHNGEVASVLMVARDVTSRKETETALQRELSVGRR